MNEIFVKKVTVLVFLHTGVEQAGPVLQTELPDGLLYEVKVLVREAVFSLQ